MARTKKNQTAVSKHLVLLNIRRGGNIARVWFKRSFSAATIVCLAGVSVKCDGL